MQPALKMWHCPCSLRELRLDGNEIRSMVSAAFRHVNQLENLSLRDNQGLIDLSTFECSM